MGIARFNQDTRIGRDDLRGPAEISRDNGFGARHGLYYISAKGFWQVRRMHDYVRSREDIRNIISKSQKADLSFQPQFLYQRLQLFFILTPSKERIAHNKELKLIIFLERQLGL